MTGRDAVKEWRREQRRANLNDKGYARFSWNNFIDHCERSDLATREQTDKWPTPEECR